MHQILRRVGTAALLAASGSACQAQPEREPSSVTQHLEAAAMPGSAAGASAPGQVKGAITLDGSNTVYPVSRAMAEEFQRLEPGAQVSVGVSGTGGGFEKFCSGNLDIADASRPINARESESCKAHGVEYMELPIGFDSLSVVVSARNTFVDCLSVNELKAMWEPAADGQMLSWSQVRPSFPAVPLNLYGKGKESGTFDYFTLAIVGAESSSRGDYTQTEDDAAIARMVGQDPNALGYFGYAKYLADEAELKPVAIDAGKGCVQPSPVTVSNGTYQPLSRPIFIYVSRASAAKPAVAAFARFYLDPNNAGILQKVGYVPLPPVSQLAASARLDRHILGSALGGHGSVVGVALDSFRDEERVANALVQ
jgi:phosphate transport system substrate-binding protein